MSPIRTVARCVPRLFTLALLSIVTLSSCGRSISSVTAPRKASQAYTPDTLADDPSLGLEDMVVVTLAPGADPAAVAAEHGAVLVACSGDGRTARFRPASGGTSAALMDELGGDTRVRTREHDRWLESAEARQQSFAFDDGLGSAEAVTHQPAALQMHLDGAHEVASGSGVTVAILDTGIDPQHPLLAAAYTGGIDLIDNDDDPTDLPDGVDNDGDGVADEAFGHGTHVAGIVHLVSPGSHLLAVRVLDADGRGDVLQVAAGVRWAVAHGARVLNLSLGSLGCSGVLQDALADAEEAGAIVVTSAGNWGAPTPVEFPARSGHALAVAAIDTTGAPASFSSYGAFVALAAPGVAVRSAYPGGEYRLWSGTSMSAPFVAGTAALLLEVHPTWTRADVLARLASAAHAIAGGASLYGAGALDTGAALDPDRRQNFDADDPPGDVRVR